MAPQPCFFIVRPDTKRAAADGKVYTVPGPIVPLVAVDELPAWLDIADVPRELSVEQTIGLCNLGTASKSKSTYAVKIIHHATPAARQSAAVKGTEAKTDGAATVGNVLQSQPAPHPAPSVSAEPKAPAATATAVSEAHPADRMKAHWSEAHARETGIAASVHNPQQPGPSTTPSITITAAGSSSSSSRNDPPTTATSTTTPALPGTSSSSTALPATTSTTATGTNPGGINGISATNTNPNPTPETEYCRHWCAYGTCKWGLHCRYLHAMPTTPRELAEVGLREIPAWWVATAAGLQQQHHQVRSHHHHHGYQQQFHSNGGYQQQQHGNGHHLNHVNHQLGLGVPGSVSGAVGDVGGGASGGPVGGPVFDPRDVRAGVIRRLGMVPLSGGIRVGGGVATPAPGGAGGHSKKAMKAQLRETVALLRELGLGVGMSNNNGKARKRDVNPLEKARGKGVDKEAVLRAARVEMAATAAGAGGQMQTGLVVVPGPVLEKVVEGGKENGQEAAADGQVVAAQKMGKLVDV